MAPDKDPPRPPALLRLPPPLRRRIYVLLGLARREGPDAHRYTYYLDGRKESRRCVGEFEPPPARNFAGLLLACRALYAEAAALLYSANRFVIFYSSEGSLGPLYALSPASLASLTNLKVVLRESSCHEPVDSWIYPPSCCCVGREDDMAASAFFCATRHSTVHSRPLLGSGELAVQAVLAEWRDAAMYVASHVRAGRLELSLVCDVDPEHTSALEVAQLAVAPLALFPPLRDCHVRLGKPPNRSIQRLAEGAVLRARPIGPPLGLASPRKPSLLLSLPPELRRCILEYTDLITPWREVTWSRQERGYQLWHPPCTDSQGGCPPYIHHGCRLRQCSPSADYPDLSPGCFCRRRHAAFSLSCHCWAPPTDLFLVCRLLCREARSVFFSGNRFVTYDSYVRWPWDLPSEQPDAAADNPGYQYERLAASQFLRDVVPANCLADLRFLELVFPPYEPDSWPLDQHPAVVDWRGAVDRIRDGINAPALTIRLVMVVDRRRLTMTREEKDRILEGYGRIIDPLKHLVRCDGLGALIVEPSFGLVCKQGVMRYNPLYDEEDWLAETEWEINELGEDEPDGDDSSLGPRDREEPRESVWQRWLDVTD